jgi:hypothetical protein
MLILAGATISILINGGLLGNANKAATDYELAAYKEKVEIDVANYITFEVSEQRETSLQGLYDYLTQNLSQEYDNITKEDTEVIVTQGKKEATVDNNFEVNVKGLEISSGGGSETYVIDTEGLIGKVYSTEYEDGTHEITINGVTYSVKITNYADDVTYTTSPTINVVEDGPMVILKYHKNLTIEEGVTLTPSVRTKGMLVLVKGTLINNGTISMTARGAIAEGQDVYLWKNEDNTWEYVPKVGRNRCSQSSKTHRFFFTCCVARWIFWLK